MEAGRKSNEMANLFDDAYADSELYEVAEMGRQVADLVTQPGWLVINELLMALRDRGMEDLLHATRPLDSKAAYAQKLGFLNGVGVALDAAATVMERGGLATSRLERDARQAEAR